MDWKLLFAFIIIVAPIMFGALVDYYTEQKAVKKFAKKAK